MIEYTDKSIQQWQRLRLFQIGVPLLSCVMMFENITRQLGTDWSEKTLPSILMPLLIHGIFGFFFFWTVRWSEPKKLLGAVVVNGIYFAMSCIGLAIGIAMVLSENNSIGEHGALYALVAHLGQLLLCGINVVLLQRLQSRIELDKRSSAGRL